MRRIIVSLAIGGLASASLVACDVENTLDSNTSVQQDTSMGTDTTGTDTVVVPPTEYYSVIVDDSEIFPTHRTVGTNPCATSSVGAHGADIDAVGLFKADGSPAGYFDTIRLAQGTQCDIAAKYKEASEAMGLPDGTLLEGFVSLGGGYIIGEFDNQALILPGYTVQVFEVGVEEGGVDEGYDVFIATNNTCGQSGASRSDCQVELGTGEGQTTFDDIGGF